MIGKTFTLLFLTLCLLVSACAPTPSPTAEVQTAEEISVATDTPELRISPTQTSEVSKTSDVSPATTSTFTVTSPAIGGYRIQFTIPVTYTKQVCDLYPVSGQPNTFSIDTAVCTPVSVAFNDVLNFTILNDGSSVPLSKIATPSFLDAFNLIYPEKIAASSQGGGYFNPADKVGPQVGYFNFMGNTVIVEYIATEAREVITNPSSGLTGNPNDPSATQDGGNNGCPPGTEPDGLGGCIDSGNP
ncbi:MAG: hypothetical protein QY306_05835 [Anaerolineales bacterium]|nr:MAG: hypothetical protein QY306_05835 [Anaerolineales bacterium]